jgi:hypothetical protein
MAGEPEPDAIDLGSLKRDDELKRSHHASVNNVGDAYSAGLAEAAPAARALSAASCRSTSRTDKIEAP